MSDLVTSCHMAAIPGIPGVVEIKQTVTSRQKDLLRGLIQGIDLGLPEFDPENAPVPADLLARSLYPHVLAVIVIAEQHDRPEARIEVTFTKCPGARFTVAKAPSESLPEGTQVEATNVTFDIRGRALEQTTLTTRAELYSFLQSCSQKLQEVFA